MQSLFFIWIPIVASYLSFPFICPHSPLSIESHRDLVKSKCDFIMYLLKAYQYLFIDTRIKAKLLTLVFKALPTFLSNLSFSFPSLIMSRNTGLVLKLAKLIPDPRSLHRLLFSPFLTGGIFPKISTWLFHSHHSGLCSNITTSEKTHYI